jgi:ribosomal protein S2
MGLEINAKKNTFVMVSRKPYKENLYVKLGTHNFETVKDYTYLGTILTNKKRIKTSELKKNYECKLSILGTSSSSKQPISNQSQKKSIRH